MLARAAKCVLYAIMRREKDANIIKACAQFLNQVVVEGVMGAVSLPFIFYYFLLLYYFIILLFQILLFDY